jgi:hypothetical protein|tara:strand:- start:514 stop:756 length:243 start_codon:yes stop_codon:yes gene_type:complete
VIRETHHTKGTNLDRIIDLVTNSDRHEAREKLTYITSLTGSAFEIDRQISLTMVDFLEAEKFAGVVELSDFQFASTTVWA